MKTKCGRAKAGVLFLLAAVVIMGLGFVCGCQTLSEKRPPPMTVSQIVEMSKSGVPAQDIIQKIHESGTVYRLKASELLKLREQGVPDIVIDYMQATHIEAIRHEQYYRDWTYGPDGYWYGGYPFGWPFWDVVVVENEHEERERHEGHAEHEHAHSPGAAEHRH